MNFYNILKIIVEFRSHLNSKLCLVKLKLCLNFNFSNAIFTYKLDPDFKISMIHKKKNNKNLVTGYECGGVLCFSCHDVKLIATSYHVLRITELSFSFLQFPFFKKKQKFVSSPHSFLENSEIRIYA